MNSWRPWSVTLALLLLLGCDDDPRTVIIGSKNFTEGVILGELLRELVAEAGVPAKHQRALGGTRLVFNALRSGEIDAYVEYTGTLTHEILAAKAPGDEASLTEQLRGQGIVLAGSIGFENNYALGMPADKARALAIETISDLRGHPQLVLRFGNEFMDRADGWRGLKAFYHLPQTDVRGVEHDLAYRALAAGDADVTDLYTTDAEIAYYGLRTLHDDRGYFPTYAAVLLYRADLPERAPRAVTALDRLLGVIGAPDMVAMNAAAKLGGEPESAVAAAFLARHLGVDTAPAVEGRVPRVLRRTAEHALLVSGSLLAAVVVAVPLGILAARQRRLGQAVLGIVGVAQTIPALALLVIMVPLFGIGAGPALVALFLYSLLPIVRNTHAGITGIPAALIESADALGLPRAARLRRIELPLALPTVLAGIKTAAVINVGAATLGALIGAGGYGQPILTGIRLDDTGLILEGAVPAAAFALATQWLFERAERAVIPRGIRPPTGSS
jgi:osmoprotectant transport system permease protein